MASIETLIDNAQSYAEDLTERADEALDDMLERIDHIGYDNVFFPGLVLPEAPDIPDDLVAPTVATIDLMLPTEPGGAPAFADISPIETGVVPTLEAVAPTISLPVVPAQLPGFNETAPVINTDYVFPEPPDQLVNPNIAVPVLTDHVVPTAPVIALPSFDAVAPVNDTEAPTNLPAQFQAAFDNASPSFISALNGQMDAWLTTYNPRYHAQLAAIEDKLAAYLAGGTGLDATVEDQIYERSRAKQEAEASRGSDAAFDAMAGRGWTVPGPSVAAGIRAARLNAGNNNAAAAREIVIMAAEMEQKNLQFAVTTSAGLRAGALSAMLSYHGNLVQINGQAVQYAVSVVDTIVRVYNLTVEQYKARLAAYQVEAQVYDTRLKAALAYVTLYEAEIRALLAMVQVDESRVALYRGQLDALKTLADVYKSRIETVLAQASLEKLKLDLFKTQTEAYVATVQGKRAEYDAYTAAINGEEAKVRIYTAEVGAFSARLTGYKTTIEAQSEVVRAQAMTNESRSANYRNTLEGYRTVVQARGDVARTQIQVNGQAFQAFDSQVRATLGNAQLRNDVYRNQTAVLTDSARLEVETLLSNQRNKSGVSASLGQVGVAAAKVFQGGASAYLSGLNTLVSQQNPDP